MRVAGVEVADDLVTELIARLREEVYVNPADKLEVALAEGRGEVGLSINERNALLDVLDDPPAGLEQLQGVLFSEYTWRVQHGLENRPPVP